MDVLTHDVYKFLTEEMKFETANQFLASATAVVASQYESWREARGKPTLRQDAKSVVYAWKQEVTRNIRTKEGATTETTAAIAPSPQNDVVDSTTSPNSNGSQRNSPSGNPPSSRVKSLPMTSKRQKRPNQLPHGLSIKKFTLLDEHLLESSPSNRDCVSNNKKKKKKASDNNSPSETQDDNKICIPLDNDVLSGRGGLTNQHRGNEWYRRLVRCSRGFYRSCPKHTKLLVAKAIVRAVHSQEPNGRFLELHDKNSNVWKEIDYKKAVDKSSQALRERWEGSDDDDILQRSMTVMFNKKLELNSQGRASRDSVEEAVYFAVISVALEYAKRWGTKGVASLTEQLRPIVKSVGNNAIPRPNGHVPRSKAVADAPLATPSKGTTRPMAAANTTTTSTKAAKKTRPVARAPSITKPPSKAFQATTTAPAGLVTATTTGTVPIRQAVMNPCASTVDQTVLPPMNRSTLATSHSFGSPAPFSNFPRIDQANSVPAPSVMHRKSASTVGDTFGSPAPPEVMANRAQNNDKIGEYASNHQSQRFYYVAPSVAAVQVNANGNVPPDGRRISNGDTFGQLIDHIVPQVPRGPIATSNDAKTTLPSIVSPTLPPDSNRNSANTAKRKLSNIATQKEIEAENEKKPKSHGMSPFHREILKMNLQLLVDS